MDGDKSITAHFSEAVVSIDASNEVTAGGAFTTRVNISEVTNLDSYQIDISYDPAVIEVIGAEGSTEGVTSGLIDSTPVPIAMWAFSPLGTQGTITVLGNIPGVAGITGLGYLVEIHFRVLGESGSTSDITLSNGLLFDNLGSEIAATWLGDSVHVTVQPGDANGDGVIDMGDVTKVERIILGIDPPTPGADANQDGDTNMGDVTKIELMILGHL